MYALVSHKVNTNDKWREQRSSWHKASKYNFFLTMRKDSLHSGTQEVKIWHWVPKSYLK